MLGDRQAGDRLDGPRPRIGRFRDDANNAAERASAIERPLRPFEDLDIVDVVAAQIGVGRVIAQADITAILADGRLGRAGEARNGAATDEKLASGRAKVCTPGTNAQLVS